MESSAKTLEFLKEYRSISETIIINGHDLTIPQLYYIYSNDRKLIAIAREAQDVMGHNFSYLSELLEKGCVIYGINTGYGGSANVRSNDIEEVQKAAIRHHIVGFGETLPKKLVRAVMLVRANSLCQGYSGVRSIIPEMLLNMISKDVIPVVPKRGSISASGDLMPTSYIAACMMGNDSIKVHSANGDHIDAAEALQLAGMVPVVFKTKEALAVVNAASFASTLAACLLYDVNIAIILTQVCTALSVEALQGRIESFHPTIHKNMPHPGQLEVAKVIKLLLKSSKLAIHELDMNRKDETGSLKQDRYALRSSPQWLGPVVETLKESIRRITTEINSVNDNSIIDHRTREVLHGGNFQGIQITVAMDQIRQALQLCGKLLFGQMQELVDVTMNNGLPPNLNGSNITTDFGFKGLDISMAAYMSELDYLANNMSNHVLSAELHNQSVNSMALVSARYTEQALELLTMMICNIMCAQVQAIDLRWLKFEIEQFLDNFHEIYQLERNELTKKSITWYMFAFTPIQATDSLFDLMPNSKSADEKEQIYMEMERSINGIMHKVRAGEHVNEVKNCLGYGTKQIYGFLRRELEIPFYYGTTTLDKSLKKIYESIKDHKIDGIITEILEYVCSDQ